MTGPLARLRHRPFLALVLVAGALTLVRLIALAFAELDLGPDEAQYWAWSKDPAWGYFSKPPFIAWVIAATTAAFGDSEWAVRLSAPLFHFGAALLLFALGARLYDARVGFWTGLGWIALPGVALSALLITTDAPLLFFWSLALLAFFRLGEQEARGRGGLFWGAILGAAIGLGLLSKYAMIYFPAGAALALALAPQMRRAIDRKGLALAALVAAALLAPNLAWNAANEFRTLSHTAANANWGASLFNADEFLEFLGAQFGVFGPVLMALLVWGLATLGARLREAGAARERDLALLAFALPPLLIVAGQAFISRAHANWAASAYPAAIVLATAWAFRHRIGSGVRASATFFLGASFVVAVAITNFAIVDAVGLSNAVKRVRGWAPQGEAVAAAAAGYDAILVDDRELMGSLLYYARTGPPIRALDSNGHVDHHYEAFMAYEPAADDRVLFVSTRNDTAPLAGRLCAIAPAGERSVRLDDKRVRTLYLFEAVPCR